VSGVAQPALSDAAREQPVTRGDGGLPSQAPGLSPALTPANVPAQAQAQAQAQAPAPVPASVVPLLPPHPEGPVGADDDSLPPPPSSLAALAARTAPLVQPALVPPAPEGEAGSPDQPVFRAEWADNDGTVLRPEPPTRHAAGPLADPPARTPLLARSTALGVLRMSTGERHPVEGPMVIGRAPWPAIASDGTSAQPVTVPSPDGQVSRHHVEVTHREGSLYVTDLGSSNGTTVRAATSEQQEQLRAHVPRELQSGMSVYLADEASFVFEAAP
jgi:hypothetical protein